MIKVFIRTTTVRKEVITDATSKPITILENEGISIAGSTVNLNGGTLSVKDQNSTFEELGVADGTTASLSVIVKADGAR